MLISCVLYQDRKKVADIPPEQIHRHVGQPNCFIWVALRAADPRALEQMQAEFGLHPLAVEDARNGHQRPKIEEYGDSLSPCCTSSNRWKVTSGSARCASSLDPIMS